MGLEHVLLSRQGCGWLLLPHLIQPKPRRKGPCDVPMHRWQDEGPLDEAVGHPQPQLQHVLSTAWEALRQQRHQGCHIADQLCDAQRALWQLSLPALQSIGLHEQVLLPRQGWWWFLLPQLILSRPCFHMQHYPRPQGELGMPMHLNSNGTAHLVRNNNNCTDRKK